MNEKLWWFTARSGGLVAWWLVAASVFFGLTGLHGAHVAVGLTLLTIAAVRAFRGHFSPEHYHGVEIPGIYWHFVDVMWIIVWAAVYLL